MPRKLCKSGRGLMRRGHLVSFERVMRDRRLDRRRSNVISEFQNAVATLTSLVGASLWASAAVAETVAVQAKSYIAAVNLLDSSQFDADAKSCQQAMAALVDCGTLNESPIDGTKASKAFRLWSELAIEATCAGGKVTKWDFKPVQQDFGSEFVFFATAGDLIKPLKTSPSTQGSSATDKVTFSYRLRGRPNEAGVKAMNFVKPRTCSFIWHEVSGTLTCKQGSPIITADLKGSEFPSHRLWVNGKQVAQLQQGPFKNLWRCDPMDPTSVK